MDRQVEDIIEQSGPTEKFILSAQQLKKAYEKACYRARKKYGLTQNELEVMHFLWKNPDFNSAKDIADSRAISRSLVCKSVESLEKQGLLTVQNDREDRRYLRLYLTGPAREIMDQAFRQENEFLNVIFKGITPEEQDVFFHILGKIRENVRAAVEVDTTT